MPEHSQATRPGKTETGIARREQYRAAKRAAILAGLRRHVALLEVLEGLHCAVNAGGAAVHPSQEWLAGQLGVHVDTVGRWLDDLEAAGILGVAVMRPHRTGHRGRYTRLTNRYWVLVRRCWARIRAGRTYPAAAPPMSMTREREAAPLCASTPLTTFPPPSVGPAPAATGPPLEADEPYRGPTDLGRAVIAAARATLRQPKRAW